MKKKKTSTVKKYSISIDKEIAAKMELLLAKERWGVSGYIERLINADLKQPRFL